MTTWDKFELPDVMLQRRAVLETSKDIEHLGNAIVCEHGNLIDIIETSVTFALEAGPQVSHQDLRSLMESNRRVFKRVSVIEAREIVNNDFYECSRRAVGFLNAGDKAASEPLSSISNAKQCEYREYAPLEGRTQLPACNKFGLP